MNNTATNSTPCPTVRKQIGKTTYIVRVHFSQTAKETMEDKIKRLLREEVRKTSSRSRRLILSSIVSFAVWLKWTRTI